MDFSYIEWPESSENDTKAFEPYDGSWLKLRYKFKEIFPKHAIDKDIDLLNIGEDVKLVKINY
jgi:hypothetical protein